MDKPRRKFTIFDAMLLVAATAIAAAWIRYIVIEGSSGDDFEVYNLYRSPFYQGPPTWISPVLRKCSAWSPRLAPLLVTFSMVVIIARCLPPRPAVRRIAFQPGVIGCVAACVPALLILTCRFAVDALRTRLGFNMIYWLIRPWETTTNDLLQSGQATLAVWLVLLLARRWRPERDWIDRVGRVLSGCWIVAYLGNLIVMYLSQIF